MESKSVERTEIESHRPEKELIGNRTIRKNAIDPAIIIFLLTIVGYGSAALYERGYRSFYKIPNKLMELNSSILVNSLISIVIIMVIGAVISSIFHIKKVKEFMKKTTEKYLIKNGAVDNGKKKLTWISKGLIFVVISISAVWSFINPSHLVIVFCILLILASSFFLLVKQIILSVIMLITMYAVMFYQIGYINAQTETQYLIAKKENLIVVDYYKDKAIVARADFEKQIIYPEYQFIKLESSEKSEQKFELKYTGTMKMSRTQ